MRPPAFLSPHSPAPRAHAALPGSAGLRPFRQILPLLSAFTLCRITAAPAPLPTFAEALAAQRDVWGEAAMAQPNGASYEFFAPLLPPPRYVNADFKYYPIVLSAPRAAVKARLIANGSGINLRGGARSWHDQGLPFTFRVGPDELIYGTFRERLSEPTLAEGYWPIVEIRYQHRSPFQSEGAVPLTAGPSARLAEIYSLEAFASTDPALAEYGVVFVKFSLVQGDHGTITVTLDDRTPIRFSPGMLTNERGETVAKFDAAWKWERQRANARLTRTNAVILAIPTKPLPPDLSLTLDYAAQRRTALATWRGILDQGMHLQTPEPLVNSAWQHLLIQNFALINGNRMHYSAGNQYDQLYEAEGSDAALALLHWGYRDEMSRLILPLLDFTRKGLEYHQAGFKIRNVCQTFWQTHDAGSVRALRPRWEKEARRIVENRTGPHGLLPAERYAGDISTPTQAINANANAWRALRDLSTVLAEIGENTESQRYAGVAREIRENVLKAIAQSAHRETTPPFIPVALYGDEPIHSPIVRTRIGSYWNIVIGYTIGSGIFPPGSPEESWIPHFQEQHGGVFMGMLRSGGDEFNFWTGPERVNPLYGTRYALDTLRRDEPERALVSFYGMLAQGFTRNTFICGEGASLESVNTDGRIFYCPPNSAANGHLLSLLRTMIIQDADLNDDGKPETLRLFFATPKRWLEDGQAIKIQRAPTAFGEFSGSLHSRLSAGEVTADLNLPTRTPPPKTLLRLRLPDGWQVVAAHAGPDGLAIDPAGTVDLSALRGHQRIRFQVQRRATPW